MLKKQAEAEKRIKIKKKEIAFYDRRPSISAANASTIQLSRKYLYGDLKATSVSKRRPNTRKHGR